MTNENHVTLIGNLTKDIELRTVPSGATVGGTDLAVNKRWKNRDTGEWEEQTSFFKLIIWNAENAAASLHKGDRVIVVGSLEHRSWDTDAGKRSVVEVKVHEIGASTRRATLTVQKVQRAQGPDAQQPQPQPQPASAAPADGEEPF